MLTIGVGHADVSEQWRETPGRILLHQFIVNIFIDRLTNADTEIIKEHQRPMPIRFGPNGIPFGSLTILQPKLADHNSRPDCVDTDIPCGRREHFIIHDILCIKVEHVPWVNEHWHFKTLKYIHHAAIHFDLPAHHGGLITDNHGIILPNKVVGFKDADPGSKHIGYLP